MSLLHTLLLLATFVSSIQLLPLKRKERKKKKTRKKNKTRTTTTKKEDQKTTPPKNPTSRNSKTCFPPLPIPFYKSWNTNLDQVSNPHAAWSFPKQCSLWKYQERQEEKKSKLNPDLANVQRYTWMKPEWFRERGVVLIEYERQSAVSSCSMQKGFHTLNSIVIEGFIPSACSAPGSSITCAKDNISF